MSSIQELEAFLHENSHLGKVAVAINLNPPTPVYPPAVAAVYRALEDHGVIRYENPVFRVTRYQRVSNPRFDSLADAHAFGTCEEEVEVTVVFRLRRTTVFPQGEVHGQF